MKARDLDSDGSYYIRKTPEGEEPIQAQEWMLKHRGIWNQGLPDEDDGLSISRNGI